MNADVNNLWQQTLPSLEKELTKIAYDTWMKTVRPLNLYENTITLGVDSEVHKNFVGNRYRTLIENALHATSSIKYEIEVVLSSEYEKNAESFISTEKNIHSPLTSFISSKYTFDSFVIGNSNRFAHAAAVAVSEDPGHAYNPYFLYGGSGLGKTHLMQAIANYIIESSPQKKVLYVTSEAFTNDLINAIKNNKNEQFREKYRNIDVLLIDDIQFIGGRDRSQEEFFHTFNALYDAEKQIIISSDKSPREMKHFEDRLVSRLEWGLTADIQQPDLETRIAILKKKAQLRNFTVSTDVLEYIADKIPSNVRDMEGALNKIIAYSSLYQGAMTVDLVPEALKDVFGIGTGREITCNIIIEHVARYFDIHIEDMRSKKRTRDITFPRQVAMYLCRTLTDVSLPKIGDCFGGRDHTTVMHAFDKISESFAQNAQTKRIIDDLMVAITGK